MEYRCLALIVTAGYGANLVGDPAKPGPYTLRLKFPAGYKLAPHTHVCNSLNLVDRSGLINEFIARNIIELATCGLHDAERLSAGVLAIYKPAAE